MVSMLATVLVFLGFALLLLGGLFFLIAAFRTGILWGLGVLLLAPVSLAFLIVHWSRAKNSFFLQVWGIGFLIIAGLALEADLPWPLE